MAEEVTQITRPSPIIEEAQKNYLTSLKDQVGTALNTDAFAPSVVGKTALDQAIQQQQATQAGLGTLSFDQTGGISGLGRIRCCKLSTIFRYSTINFRYSTINFR